MKRHHPGLFTLFSQESAFVYFYSFFSELNGALHKSFIPFGLSFLQQMLKCPYIHPTKFLIQCQSPLVKLNGLFITNQFPETVQSSFKRIIGTISVCFRPESIRYLIFSHISTSKSD